MTAYDYLIFPAEYVQDYFRVYVTGGYLSSEDMLERLKAALADGYRWVRTEGDNAIFEKETQS